MALPPSGPLSLSAIRTEIGYNENAFTQNIASSIHPNFTKMSQFYGYVVTPVVNLTGGYTVSNGSVNLTFTANGTLPAHVAFTIPYTLSNDQGGAGAQLNQQNPGLLGSPGQVASIAVNATSATVFQMSVNPVTPQSTVQLQSQAFNQTCVISGGSSTTYTLGVNTFTLNIPAFPIVHLNNTSNANQPYTLVSYNATSYTINWQFYGHNGITFLFDPGGGLSQVSIAVSSNFVNQNFTYSRGANDVSITPTILYNAAASPLYFPSAPASYNITIPRQPSTIVFTNATNTVMNIVITDASGNRTTQHVNNTDEQIVYYQQPGDATVTYSLNPINSPGFIDLAVYARPFNSTGGYSILAQTVSKFTSASNFASVTGLDLTNYSYSLTLTNTPSVVVPTIQCGFSTFAPTGSSSASQSGTAQMVFVSAIPAGVTINLGFNLFVSLVYGIASFVAKHNGVGVYSRSTSGSPLSFSINGVGQNDTVTFIFSGDVSGSTVSALNEIELTLVSATLASGNANVSVYQNSKDIDFVVFKTVASGGGSGGAVCLLADQRLIIDEQLNSKNVQDFTTGDTVYTAHETTQKFGIYEVSNAIVDSVDHWYRVETTSGRFIKCSPTHLFMINGFKKSAQCLKLSDELMIADGETFVKEKLKSIQIFEETVNVYKIEVADAHTYLTDNMIWQHNFKAPGGTA